MSYEFVLLVLEAKPCRTMVVEGVVVVRIEPAMRFGRGSSTTMRVMMLDLSIEKNTRLGDINVATRS